MASYNDLEIYKVAYDLSIKIHRLSMKLPQFELYEQGSQLRRSSKSIKDNIAEGYGRRKFKQDYIKFLVYAHASCDETLNHITTISELYPDIIGFKDYISEYEYLGRRINKYIQYVESNWNYLSEPNENYPEEPRTQNLEP